MSNIIDKLSINVKHNKTDIKYNKHGMIKNDKSLTPGVNTLLYIYTLLNTIKLLSNIVKSIKHVKHYQNIIKNIVKHNKMYTLLLNIVKSINIHNIVKSTKT